MPSQGLDLHYQATARDKIYGQGQGKRHQIHGQGQGQALVLLGYIKAKTKHIVSSRTFNNFYWLSASSLITLKIYK